MSNFAATSSLISETLSPTNNTTSKIIDAFSNSYYAFLDVSVGFRISSLLRFLELGTATSFDGFGIWLENGTIHRRYGILEKTRGLEFERLTLLAAFLALKRAPSPYFVWRTPSSPLSWTSIGPVFRFVMSRPRILATSGYTSTFSNGSRTTSDRMSGPAATKRAFISGMRVASNPCAPTGACSGPLRFAATVMK